MTFQGVSGLLEVYKRMGDATARRERRRQRILENSENRMKRITGDVQSWSDAKSQPTSPHSQSSFHHPIDTDTVMREHMPREPSQGGMENPDISSSYEPEALSNPRQRTVFTRKVDSMEPSHMSQITELQTSNQKTDVINDPVFALLLNFLGEKNIPMPDAFLLAGGVAGTCRYEIIGTKNRGNPCTVDIGYGIAMLNLLYPRELTGQGRQNRGVLEFDSIEGEDEISPKKELKKGNSGHQE
ncbi:unnamed protein product [Darwinula stevensoni]|uniref:Uncharacterized protein n=1 Tax=Darwinula stevensoni TaxID=69355 RepID=A0A7R9A1S7_9CRUS|nr:unnamed protein product [Darwinula stevensoni]CAG0878544.1 unnamed protein product [Darwinula stevensoni]